MLGHLMGSTWIVNSELSTGGKFNSIKFSFICTAHFTKEIVSQCCPGTSGQLWKQSSAGIASTALPELLLANLSPHYTRPCSLFSILPQPGSFPPIILFLETLIPESPMINTTVFPLSKTRLITGQLSLLTKG